MRDAAHYAPTTDQSSSLLTIKQSDAWRPLGRRFGGVTLAGHPGAVATVEATWVPLASGSLPVPVLSLQASCCSVCALPIAVLAAALRGCACMSGCPFELAQLSAVCLPEISCYFCYPQDVSFQEVYDAGLSLAGTSAITVVEPSSL